MEKKQQKILAQNLLKDLSESIMKNIDRIPENWDGNEIRMLIADYYKTHYIFNDTMKAKRLKDYKEAIIANNLI